MKDVMEMPGGIMVSPTGARLGKGDHPRVPITAQEIADEAAACFAAGAEALHLHVRDGKGRHSLDPGRYREAMAAVRAAAPGMAVQITTESGGIYDVEQQAACLRDVAPDWASVALREMERDDAAAARVYGEAEERGTVVQHILYTPDDVRRLFAWQRQGIVRQGPLSVIFVLGQYGTRAARPEDLLAFLAQGRGEGFDWMACAFGPNERACLLAAMRAGGRVRIGFENNIFRPDGRRLENNAQSVRLLREHWAETPELKGLDACRTYSQGI